MVDLSIRLVMAMNYIRTLRHQYGRRRAIESALRRFTTRARAISVARRIP